MTPAIWIGIIAAVLGCYFAALHSALKIMSRRRLADLLVEHKRDAAAADWLSDRLGRLLLVTGVLRACMALLVVLGCLYVIEVRWPGLGRPASFAIAFGVGLVVVSVLTVAVAVSWAMYRRERLLLWSLPILKLVHFAFYPLIGILTLADPVVRRISGVDLQDHDQDELANQVLTIVEDHEEGESVDAHQKEMIEAVFDLPRTTAGEIMTPRTDIHAVEVHTSLAAIKQAVLTDGHSRIPVFDESIDDIVGLLYAKDLIRYLGEALEQGETFDLQQVLREPYVVPETKSVSELLAEFKARKVHLAMVVDEYGGTAGLVTIEDILEELVGEIQDEYEEQEQLPEVQRINDHAAEVDARVHIDDLNDALSLELPEDEDYDTVGGFVFATLGHVPEAGESFEAHDVKVTVTAAEKTKVLRVRLERPDGEPLVAEPSEAATR
jgi:CBS domain containing-hemolysin-like protein